MKHPKETPAVLDPQTAAERMQRLAGKFEQIAESPSLVRFMLLWDTLKQPDCIEALETYIEWDKTPSNARTFVRKIMQPTRLFNKLQHSALLDLIFDYFRSGGDGKDFGKNGRELVNQLTKEEQERFVQSAEYKAWVKDAARAARYLRQSAAMMVFESSRESDLPPDEKFDPTNCGGVVSCVVVSYAKSGNTNLGKLAGMIRHKVKGQKVPPSVKQWAYKTREKAKKNGWWDAVPNDYWKSYK
ncbi:MAG: hypothetical protein LAP85_27365 [Acidobacteriia bacterium]|nr:hypothetical protein [Terriglobia bacterium]